MKATPKPKGVKMISQVPTQNSKAALENPLSNPIRRRTKLRPTYKNNPCAICENAKGDCRQGTEDSTYWQCMSYADTKKGEIVSGYKCLGVTRCGQWAQFKPDNPGERIERVQSARPAIRNSALLTAKREAEERKYSLSATERHEGYTQLLAELELHPDDRADLVRRGFTDEQIILSGFKSISPYQYLKGTYHELLPGIENRRITLPHTGYLCPIRDSERLIVGFQIRLRNPEEKGRYRWLSGGKGTLKLNGELPLAVHRPEGKPDGIEIVEGVGAKPFLESQRGNKIVIGAAGGQWANSKAALEKTLKAASLESNGTKEVVFPLDAGDVLNSSVMGRWNRAEQLITELGYTVRFAWWGQLTKEASDIDEIDLTQTKINYYSSEDFRSIVGATVKKWETNEAIRKVQEPLRKLTYKPDLLLNTRYIPKSIIPLIPTGLIALKAPKGSGKSQLIREIIRIESEGGCYILSITPRIALGREQAFKWKITWIGDKGNTNKIAESSDKEDNQIKALGGELVMLKADLEALENTPIQLSLLSSNRKSAEEADFRGQIEELEERIFKLQSASYKRLGLCWDSLWKTNRMDMRGALIILDEAEMGLTHLMTSKTCRHNRASILKTLEKIIPDCLLSGGRVTLTDADLSDLPIDYINALLPTPIKPYVIVNEFTDETTRWNVTLVTGSKDLMIDDSITRLANGERVAITTDSQAEAEALEKLILQRIPEFCSFVEDGEITKKAVEGVPCVVRIDSKITRCDAGKIFVEHPNEEIIKWQPRCLIYSPSMGIGVSIDESVKRDGKPYFDAVYGLFFRVIVPSQCRQQLARVRANVPRIVWVSGLQPVLEGCPSFFPDEVNRQTMKYRTEGALDIMELAESNLKEACKLGNSYDDDEIFEEACRLRGEYFNKASRLWNNPHLELYSKIKARDNYGRVSLPELLEKELREEGHEVTISIGAKTATGEAMKGFKDEIKQEKAEGIANAPDKKEKEIQELRQNPTLKPEEEYAIKKFDLTQKVPGLELTPDYVRKALVADRGRWLASQKLFYFLGNLEAVRTQDGHTLAQSWSRWAKGTAFAPDCHQVLPKVRTLIASGVFDWIDLTEPEKDYKSNSPEGKAFLLRCLKHKSALWTALNIKVSEQSTPIDLAQKLLGKAGLQLKKHKSNGSRKYQIDVDLLNDPDRIATLEAFQRAWEEGQIKPGIPGEEVIESLVEELPGLTSKDIGKPSKVRRIEGIFGNSAGLSAHWDMGYRLLEVPSEFRDSYILESPEGKRVSLFDIELMTDEDGTTYFSEVAERMKEVSIDEAMTLWGHCEAIGESLNLSQDTWLKLSTALAVAV